ncbi:MAG: UDP-N-acetylmuramoyl-L-alanyl-D-glutamate--2,6-diaminopimelate ligase [Planctomycetota bacterium]|jgi:UDP-N-acetylmuramoyl-L-alanyl-D-glutamate--2,6-diaminopimelate ligase
MARRLSDLVHGLCGERVNFSEAEIHGVVCDSRKVQPGYIFVAVPGTRADGHDFIADAVQRGAAAVVYQKSLPDGVGVPAFRVDASRKAMAELAARIHSKPTHQLNVVGVTGTNGKSTTVYLMRSILEAAGEKVGLLGTIQYMLGSRAVPAPVTTPGCDDLQSYFSEMVGAGCRSAVMEVSSHALDQDRVFGTRFAAGVFTNLTRDHIDYHRTMEDYRDAKAKLFGMLPERGIAVLNADDPVSGYLAERTRARVIRYGLNGGADITASVDSCTLSGTRFTLGLGAARVPVRSRLVGRHNVSNMLAAASCAWSMGYDADPIRAGLQAMTAMPGRLEPVDEGQEFGVFVDYAHTDDALRNVLESLRPIVRGRIILVFGCGGDRDRGKRSKMGHVAEQRSDLAIVTSDNPRSENPLDIIRGIEGGFRNKSRYLIEPDRRAAIKLGISLARPGDAVLIAGKGHETIQIFRDCARPFDDRMVAREILGGFGAR